MNHTTLVLDQPVESGSLELVFFRSEDRWAHKWCFSQAGNQHDLLTSLEGNDLDHWPPSPPLQDVSLEDLGSIKAMMGVGMAGKSHWSASYSTENGSIKADLACLQKGGDETPELMSTYQIGKNVQFGTDEESGGVILRITANETEWVVRPFTKTEIPTLLNITERTLVMSPVEISTNSRLSTRWGFCVESRKT